MSLNMQLQSIQEAKLYGITKNDLQEIYENATREFRTRVFFLDASYMYTFHLDDFESVKKFNILGRYDINAVKEWHRCLERWYQDQTVTLGGRTFKPIKISRTFDRVVNEGLSLLADAITGSGPTSAFNCRAIGDGDLGEPTLADTDLVHLIDIINVNNAPEGGSLSRDGTTIYSIGNHAKTVETPDNNEFTECGMFDDDDDSKAMLDHSAFVDPIPHTQNEDAPGSTTVIYICSG